MSRTSNILLVIGCAIAVTGTILITMRPTKTSALPENIQAAAIPPALPPLTPKLVTGQQIAESGSAGNSSAEHLDFRILIGGMFVNPLDYLP